MRAHGLAFFMPRSGEKVAGTFQDIGPVPSLIDPRHN